MTTASVQDIDAFIRLQKEKLNRDRDNGYGGVGGGGFEQPIYNPSLDYNRQQLDNYLNLARNPIDQYRPIETFIPPIQSPAPQQVSLPQQQQQQPPVQQRQNNRNNQQDQQGDFFQNFGSKYDVQKNKLKNELQNEYSQYIQQKANKEARQKSKNQTPVSDEFYATLPLGGLGATREHRVIQRNTEYNVLKEKLENSAKRNSNEWWKDKNEPEIKPYSKHVGSSENVSNINNSPFAYDTKVKSQSQFDVISDRRLQQPQQVQPRVDPNGYDPNFQRTRSANSFENLNRYPSGYDLYQQQLPPTHIPAIDPSLADILRRPPVGLRSAIGIPQSGNRVQFNESVQYTQYQPNNYYQEPQRSYAPDSYRNSAPQPPQNNRPKDNNPFSFGDNQNKDSKAQKAREYQEELERQVREKQLKKQKEKEDLEKLDKKIMLENAIYNPYGRSGGGAPIKDKEGNTVANLSQVKADPNQYSPRDLPPPQALINNLLGNINPGFSSRSNSNDFLNTLQLNNQIPQLSGRRTDGDQPTFARGGNGIFGEGKSDDQKRKGDKYKAELQQQIEEKQRQKALEKERQRIEDEKEQKRIEEEQRKIKAELEEEERKRKQKEENEKNLAENAKRLAEENRKQVNKRVPNNKPVNKRVPRKPSGDFQPPDDQPIIPSAEFRTNSPPVPAAAKKLNGGKAPPKNLISKQNTFNDNENLDDENGQPPARNFSPPPPKPVAPNKNKLKSNTTADYYITESRLNVSSPTKKVNQNLPTVDDNEERVPSVLVNDYQNENFKETKKTKFPIKNNNKTTPKEKTSENIIPTKPVLRKVSRPSSQVSNSEVLAQLSNLKKHLQNELNEVENKRNNANGQASVGQMVDLRENLLNVRTPTDDRRNQDYGFKTYRKDIETPPLRGGLEPKTYFRDNTILLDSNQNNIDIFSNDLQREANSRQLNRLNSLLYQDDPFKDGEFNQKLSAQNQLRLKKLRDMEDDSLSLNDPNDVLNKFINRNNRQPSAVTIQDDTWLRQPV